jgi:hypothetical protein
VSYFAVFPPCGDRRFLIFVTGAELVGWLRLSRSVKAMYCGDNKVDLYNMLSYCLL